MVGSRTTWDGFEHLGCTEIMMAPYFEPPVQNPYSNLGANFVFGRQADVNHIKLSKQFFLLFMAARKIC